jgi:hypothetical protein
LTSESERRPVKAEIKRAVIRVELALRSKHTAQTSGLVLAALLCVSSWASAQTFDPCDLNRDGLINATDMTLAVNMALGTAPCTANVEGPLTCTVLTVQRVFDASQGGSCLTYNSLPGHSATLNWVASTSSNLAGYNIYRGTTSGGPYSRVNTALVLGTTYIDNSVHAGQSYYYVATAVDIMGNESEYSNQATGVIPAP